MASADRVALVTGAGRRIGRAIALDLASAGYDIAVHYHSSEQKALDTVAEIRAAGVNAEAVQADLSREDQTARLIADAGRALGPLSLLVNCASQFVHDDIDTMSRESWDRHMETNLRAPLKLAQDFAAQAQDGAGGGAGASIINIIDQRVWKLTPQFLSYTISKSALFTVTRTLAQALGPRGVRVNAIGPGPVLRNERQSEEDWRQQNAATILGHGASPADICAAVRYLASAGAVTGQMIAVDGGQHLAWETPDAMVKE